MTARQLTITDHRLVGASWCESPNQGPRPADAAIELLVIHNISLPPGRFGNGYVEAFFCNRLPVAAHPYFATIAELRVSAHLLIKRAGELVQFVPFDRRAWHAGQSCWQGRDNCNDFSIGIELEGTDRQPYSDAQYDALLAVSRALLGAYPRLTPTAMVGHCDIAPGRKSDPGPAFDWQRLRQGLGCQD